MDLEKLFYPKSIAVIGASSKLGGGKLPYYLILKMIGYNGELYPVNPKYDEMDGVRFYHSLDELPEGIDLVIVTAPKSQSLEIMKAAARRKVKFIHFFTAGFSEMGNHEMEEEIIREARRGGTRIVGPNCIGVYCPEGRVSFGFSIQQQNGNSEVCFIGQSGGVTTNFVRMAVAHYLGLNKVVSYGNQIDIRAEDYLSYFAGDPRVRVLGAYIEDLKEPQRFLDILKEITAERPVFILKGGMSEAGAKAAASHTGAMASNYRVWASAMSQGGGVLVDTFEELVNTIMIGVSDRTPAGPRVGFLGAGGGTAVTFTDCAELAGLSVPTLAPETQKRIAEKISDVNTSTANPVDLGMFGFDFNIMAEGILSLDADEGVDVIVPYFSIDFINNFQKDKLQTGPNIILEAVGRANKPVVPVISRFSQSNLETEEARIGMFKTFREAGLPVYATIQDCAGAIAKYLEWLRKKEARG